MASAYEILQGAINSAFQQGVAQKQAEEKLMTERNALAENVVSLTEKGNQGVAEKVRVEEQAKLDTQTANQNFAMANKWDLRQQDEILTALGQKMNTSFAEAAKAAEENSALKAKIASKASVSLFDSPIEFLINQVELPDMVNAAAAKDDFIGAKNAEGKLYQDHLQAANTTLSQTAQAQKAIEKNVTEATVFSATQAAQAKADLEIVKAKLNFVDVQTANLDRLRNLNTQQIDLLAKSYSADMQQKQYALSAANFEMQKKEHEEREKEKKDDVAYTTRALIAGYSLSGKTPPPLPTDPKELKRFLELDPRAKIMYTLGSRSLANASTDYPQVLLGDTVEAVEAYTNGGRDIIPQALRPAFDKAIQDVDKDAAASKRPLTGAARTQMIAAKIQENQAILASSAASVTSANPYVIPMPKEIVTMVPAMKDNLVVQRAQQMGITRTEDMGRAVESLVADVTKGAIPFEDVRSAISSYGVQGVIYNKTIRAGGEARHLGAPQAGIANVNVAINGRVYNMADSHDRDSLLISNKPGFGSTLLQTAEDFLPGTSLKRAMVRQANPLIDKNKAQIDEVAKQVAADNAARNLAKQKANRPAGSNL